MITTLSRKSQIADFCGCVFEPQDTVELRLLPSGKSTWHRAGDLSEQFAKLNQQNERGENIHIAPNPRRESGQRNADGVMLARCLFADFDATGRDDAEFMVRESGMPSPNLLLASGGGVHAYWRLAEPITDLGEWSRLQRALAVALGSDMSVHDPPRLMRLPGFLNRKYDEDIYCEVLEADPDARHDLEDIRLAIGPVEGDGGGFPWEQADAKPAAAPTVASASLDTLARATAYVAKVPGVGEGGRNGAAFKLAAVLKNDFLLPEPDAARLLAAWNLTNSPPLPEGELQAVLASAATSAKLPAGSKSERTVEPSYQVRFGGGSTNGNGNGHAVATLPAPAAIVAPPISYRRITSKELDSGDFAEEYLIDNVLVARQPCILAGAYKVMKTSVLIDLAISLSTGGHFLGYFKVRRRAAVGVMSGESGLSTIQATARRICEAAGMSLQDAGVIWSDSLPKFGDALHTDAVRRFIKADGLEQLTIDPTYFCMSGENAGNVFAQGELLRSIAEVCQECNCGLILAHHTKRSVADPTAPPELGDIAWSGFAEFARQWLLLGRREPYTPGTGEHKLWLSVGGSAGHSGLYGLDIDEGTREAGRMWGVTVATVGNVSQERAKSAADKKAAKQAENEVEYTRRLRAALLQFKQGNTTTKLREASGLNATNYGTALRNLLADGKVEACQIEKRGQTYDGYKPTQHT